MNVSAKKINCMDAHYDGYLVNKDMFGAYSRLIGSGLRKHAFGCDNF
jgi:hypothetical protein